MPTPTPRHFRVASMPKLMAEKPNNWDPHNQKDVFKEPFEHPPVPSAASAKIKKMLFTNHLVESGKASTWCVNKEHFRYEKRPLSKPLKTA